MRERERHNRLRERNKERDVEGTNYYLQHLNWNYLKLTNIQISRHLDQTQTKEMPLDKIPNIMRGNNEYYVRNYMIIVCDII